jgi:PAS domain S-box-containing protein
LESHDAEPSAPVSAQAEAQETAQVETEPDPFEPEPAAAQAVAVDPLSRNAGLVFERLPFGILVSRGEVPIFANRHLLDLLGYEDEDAFYEAGGMDRMFAGRPSLPREIDGAIPIVKRSGETVLVHGRVQSIEWDGLPATLLTLNRSNEDMPQRVAMLEGELNHLESEARELNAILDTATDGIAIIDTNGRILSLNRSGEALFGYDQNEVTGEPFTALFAQESHAAALDYFARLKSSGVASLLNDGCEVLGLARQGGLIPIFMTLGHVGSGSETKFCAVLRDMTHWKKVEQDLNDARKEAERANALKSDFLAKISHEIRTPLNAIIGFAEVIMDERFGPIGNDRYKEYLKDIHASGAHVMSLVNDLLDLSKIEAGKMELSFAPVDANRIISECVSIMQPQANHERVIMRLALSPKLPPISADERSLRQIILNLLSNAVKFNEPGGQVIVSTTVTETGKALIRIRDTGIGMSDSDVETALEPFRQLATSRPTTGTGLGLPLTKALIEANRASLTIKSKKDEGTLIEVAFTPARVMATS